MAKLDALLEPIKGENPCGADLWQDGSLMLLQQMITMDSESSEEPKWSAVRETAFEILSKGKDLRAGVILCLALLREEGVAGFRDGLAYLQGLLKKYPIQLYPVPEGKDDPSRGYALSNLSAPLGSESPYQFVRWLREAPLCRSGAGLSYSTGDLKRADRGTPKEGAEGQAAPTRDQIESAFRAAGPEEMLKTFNLFADVQTQIEAIEKLLSSPANSSSGLDLAALKGTLGDILAELKPWTGQATTTEEPKGQGNPTNPQPAGAGPIPVGIVGVIRSRQDADNTLKAVCEYFRQNEPSSPIPFFLDRVRRLIGRNFVECVRDLSSESLEKFYPLFGIKPSDSEVADKKS